MLRRIIPIIFVLTFATLACGFRVENPIPASTLGPTVTDDVHLPVPAGETEASLSLEFGVGELFLSPGAEDALVDGTFTYNIPDFKPEIETNGADISIRQGEYEFTNFPNFEALENKWDLALGSVPLALDIKGGAYQAEWKFGGLALTALSVQDGASDVVVDFSSPNQVEMSLLRYETGASNITLKGLGNANFDTLIFKGGAGNFGLDFSGEFQRDGTVTIESGLSNLMLTIPEGIDVQLTVEGGLTNTSIPAGWGQRGDTYTRSGDGPTLKIFVEVGAGNLTITE